MAVAIESSGPCTTRTRRGVPALLASFLHVLQHLVVFCLDRRLCCCALQCITLDLHLCVLRMSTLVRDKGATPTDTHRGPACLSTLASLPAPPAVCAP